MENFKLRTIITTKDESYLLVDTSYIRMDSQYETMVFNCDKEGNIKGMELDSDTAYDEDEATAMHKAFVQKWS